MSFAVFFFKKTQWKIYILCVDPGEVAVCFGDDGTWCPLYKHDIDGEIQQTYSDGEETISSLASDDDLANLTQNVQTLNIDNKQILTTDSRTSNPFLSTISTNMNAHNFWSQQQMAMSDGRF